MDITKAQVVEGFDLDSLETVTQVTHKCAVITDDDGNPVTGFILAGKNSDEYVGAIKTNHIGNIMRSGKRKQSIDPATEAGATVVANTVARNDRNVALAIIVGWFGFNKGGQPLAFDKTMVPAMLDRCPQWQIKVLSDLEAEANFMPASSKA